MAGIKLEVTIDDAATQVYAAIAQRMGNGKALMQAIGQTMVSSTIRRFGTQSGPDGKPWAPLSKATRRKRGANAKALLASGRLRQSITFVASAMSVEVGTNLIYARIQQMGTAGLEGGAIQMPERTTTIYRSTRDLNNGRSRFVKKSKSDFATDHKVAAHTVTIPGRPYLGMSVADEKAIAALVHKFAMGD
jgi:phage virion morphogenesis protein